MTDQDNKILVLGLGNDILCDDGVGLQAARELERRLAGHPRVDVRETTEMGLSLLDHIIGYQDLVIVDSIQTKQVPPGHIFELEPAGLKVLPRKSPHFFGVGEILTLGRNLELTVPTRVKIFAIEVSDPFTITEQMTPVIQAALPGLVERVLAELVRLESSEIRMSG